MKHDFIVTHIEPSLSKCVTCVHCGYTFSGYGEPSQPCKAKEGKVLKTEPIGPSQIAKHYYHIDNGGVTIEVWESHDEGDTNYCKEVRISTSLGGGPLTQLTFWADDKTLAEFSQVFLKGAIFKGPNK